MAELEVAQLNSAATKLYNHAFELGRQEGQEQERCYQAEHSALSLLDVAATTLKAALNVAGDDWTFELAISRMILGRTPMVVGGVGRALGCIRPKRSEDPSVEKVAEALGHVEVGISELTGRLGRG